MLDIIGDVHGEVQCYVRLAREAPCSVALGDVGFRAEYAMIEQAGLDATRHRILQGNHDWYAARPPARVLGDFGTCRLCEVSFFYVRGAASLDRAQRTEGVDWFREEELSYRRMQEAIDLYASVRPHLILSHEAPLSVLDALYPTRRYRSTTNRGLQAMLDLHRPQTWVFGHHHRSWRRQVGRTHFVGLRELEVLRVGPDGRPCGRKKTRP